MKKNYYIYAFIHAIGTASVAHKLGWQIAVAYYCVAMLLIFILILLTKIEDKER